jgi:hypothetical protein
MQNKKAHRSKKRRLVSIRMIEKKLGAAPLPASPSLFLCDSLG